MQRGAIWLLGRVPRSWLKAAGHLRWRSPRLKRAIDWVAARLNRQDGVIQQGVGRGLAFNTGGSNPGYLLGTSEPAVQNAFRELVTPGTVVYDVGANVGFYTVITARLVGLAGAVVAFEPLPANVAWVEHNVALNGFRHVRVRAEALGDANGEADFHVSHVSAWGKLAAAGASGSATGLTRVRVRTLDAVLSEVEPPPPPSLMKLDVEGAEASVLRGARSTITAHRPVLMIELHGTWAEVEPVLQELGYVACALGSADPISARPWDAFVLAAPAERLDLVARIKRLTDTAIGDR